MNPFNKYPLTTCWAQSSSLCPCVIYDLGRNYYPIQEMRKLRPPEVNSLAQSLTGQGLTTQAVSSPGCDFATKSNTTRVADTTGCLSKAISSLFSLAGRNPVYLDVHSSPSYGIGERPLPNTSPRDDS